MRAVQYVKNECVCTTAAAHATYQAPAAQLLCRLPMCYSVCVCAHMDNHAHMLRMRIYATRTNIFAVACCTYQCPLDLAYQGVQ